MYMSIFYTDASNCDSAKAAWLELEELCVHCVPNLPTQQQPITVVLHIACKAFVRKASPSSKSIGIPYSSGLTYMTET